jgi:hypothetical protein
MRVIVVTILLLSLSGCFVESRFKLADNSPLPAGLKRDPKLTGVAHPRVEVWFYTYDPVAVKVFDKDHCEIFEYRGTWRWATKADSPASFFVTIDGVETAYKQIGPENTIAVVQKGS